MVLLLNIIKMLDFILDDLKPFFLECVHFSYEKGQLPNTQKGGMIIMLSKPQKDLLLPLNYYRLITLLNIDYKKIASIIVE